MIVSRSRTMHLPVTPINYWRNCTEGVWRPCYFGSDIWLKDGLSEASSVDFQSSFWKTCILRKSWRVFHDRSLLGRCFRGFVLPVLEYCSAVWCSAADTHLKLLDRAISVARFLTGGVFECDISHRRSVAVLCMLYKIRCNPVHPLTGALPEPYVPVRVTRGALVAHRYTYAPPRCRTLQYSRTFIPFSTVWDWRVSRAGPMLFYWPKLPYPYYSRLLFLPFFLSIGWYCGAGVFGLIVYIILSQPCTADVF